MHATEQGVFQSTPFFKCIALGVPSDKLPFGDTTSPPPPSSNLKPDIASHQMFNFPLFEIKWYVKHALPWMQNPVMHVDRVPEPVTLALPRLQSTE